MPSISFDRIAHLYDATRGYSDEVAHQIALAIEQAAHATPETTFLEMGIGTGRIAFPLASLGHVYSGVDISEKMLEQLRAKLFSSDWQQVEQPWGSGADEAELPQGKIPNVWRFVHTPASMRLVAADMTKLPFRDASFDVVLAVHVFHLVSDWRQAVKEALRVLRPGGMLLHCGDDSTRFDNRAIYDKWREIVESRGGSLKRTGAASHRQIIEFLHEQGLQTQTSYPVHWEVMTSPREVVEYFAQRHGSSLWAIPDDIFLPAVEQLRQWATDQYKESIDEPRKRERRFAIHKTILP